MEFGQESSQVETEPTDWWGPDLTLPYPGDLEYSSGKYEFNVSLDTWQYSKSRQTMRCEPPGMPAGYYKITEREVIQDFMSNTYKYYITVEWEIDT